MTLMTCTEAGYRDLTCRFRVSIKIADQQHRWQLSTQSPVRVSAFVAVDGIILERSACRALDVDSGGRVFAHLH